MRLEDAIERSSSHTEIVDTEFFGDHADLMAALGSISDCELDSARENNGTIDVWGWADETPKDEQDWRLNVTLTAKG